MARRLVGLDFETYYDSKTYSLRKMDVPSYVCDPRFEITLVAVKEGHNRSFIVDAPDIPRYLKDLGDPNDVTLYGHNLMFDACIASWVLNWRAGLNVCTLALARQTIAKDLRSLALASVAKYLGLQEKGTVLASVDGMRRHDIIQSGRWAAYCEYARGDIDIAYDIYNRLAPLVPPEEHVIADMVLRMATEPMFKLDYQLLQDHYAEVVDQKQHLLAQAMLAGGLHGREDLMSNDKFATVLESLGVDPPTKVSLTTGRETWAFAKSDEEMRELTEHEDPCVQAVVAARLGHKSTIEETRAARYLNISTLNFPAFGQGLFPVPLKVSGAHTHRLSGEWKLNAQNMGRKSKLRKALRAPDGYVVVVGDESQIEARMTAVFAGQWDLVDQFARNLDPYSIMATKIFKVPVTKADKPRRFVGKQTILSAQYGVGHNKFYSATRAKARDEGVEFLLTLEECENVITTYRTETFYITEMRARLNKCIPLMADPNCNFAIGPITFLHNKIRLPNGHYLYYEKLRYDTVSGNWIFTYQGNWKRLYGGKLLENIIQALARVVVMQAMLRLRKQVAALGGRIVMQCHDELVLIVPLQHEALAKQILEAELTRTVEWMPRLPVACEVHSGFTYGDAK